MSTRFCPICGDILFQQEMTIGGSTDMYWVCPEGDWEEPVNPSLASAAEEPEAES